MQIKKIIPTGYLPMGMFGISISSSKTNKTKATKTFVTLHRHMYVSERTEPRILRVEKISNCPFRIGRLTLTARSPFPLIANAIKPQTRQNPLYRPTTKHTRNDRPLHRKWDIYKYYTKTVCFVKCRFYRLEIVRLFCIYVRSLCILQWFVP